jgi:hypothetical protein
LDDNTTYQQDLESGKEAAASNFKIKQKVRWPEISKKLFNMCSSFDQPKKAKVDGVISATNALSGFDASTVK